MRDSHLLEVETLRDEGLRGWSPVATLCDTLAALCRMGSREALRTQIISLSGSPTSCIEGHRYAELAFVQVSIALGSSAGVSPSYYLS